MLEFSPGLNILQGTNGAGKTTVLEALTMCAFTRTFLPTSDADLMRFGADESLVYAEAISDRDQPYRISVKLHTNSRKEIESNEGANLRPKDVIGRMPMVVLSPDFKNITFGSPADRRSFLDRLLSQCSARYLEDLSDLRRVLKQRNTLLSAKNGFLDRGILNAWTEQLIELSCDISIRRRDFIREFQPFCLDAYAMLTHSQEHITVQYEPDFTIESNELNALGRDQLRELLRKQADECVEEELRRGLTLWGPQKDDIDIRIHGARAREVASQGQHKSLLISLKKAEFEYLRAAKAEEPILLLDDIFSELDQHRTARVFDTVIAQAGQCFITTTEFERFRHDIGSAKQCRVFEVDKGSVQRHFDIVPA